MASNSMDARGSASQGTPPVFESDGLTKFYGSARGVESVSLRVDRGEIFGLLGPNGAGKTTLIRSALGLLRPTSGEIRLFGDPVRTYTDTNHERLGYLPADLRLWSWMQGKSISNLLLRIGGKRSDPARRDQLALRLELDMNRRVKSLSLGNRQKVGLLLALQHAPELLILDEPTSGLDPLVRKIVMDLLREEASRGTTIIYSSHNLTEVDQICSRIGILRRGRVVAVKPIEEIRAEQERMLEFTFADGLAPAEGLPAGMERFRLARRNGATWQVAYHGSPDPLIRWLAERDVLEFSPVQVSLEEAFLTYYHDEGTPR